MPSNRLNQVLRSIRRGFAAEHFSYLLLNLVMMLIGWLVIASGGQDPAGTALSVAIGGSLVATGAAGAVLFLRVWVARDESERLKNLRESGIRKTFEARSVAIRSEYDERLASASDAIEIMGFGLRSLRHDHEKDFEDWAKRATVRILVIDPEFPRKDGCLADMRDVEEGDGEIKDDVRKLVRSCSALLKLKTNGFELRLYTCLPSINLFRIDEDVFWGPYLVGDISRNLPTLLMDADSKLSRRLIAHFDEVRRKFSREVPVEWLEPDAEG